MGSAGLGEPVHDWLTCVVLLDLRRLLIARGPPGPVASSAFFLGSLPVATDMERKIDLVAEALPGRWDMGGGRPIRLKSTASGLPSGVAVMVREPFMVDQANPART